MVVVLLHLANLRLIVLLYLLLAHLFVFNCCIVFLEKSLRLVMDEVTKHLEGIPLLDGLLFEQLGDRGDALPQFLQLLRCFFVLQVHVFAPLLCHLQVPLVGPDLL